MALRRQEAQPSTIQQDKGKSMTKFLFITSVLLFSRVNVTAQSRQDPRLQLITRSQLLTSIAKTPLNSRQHGRLIGRARASNLIPVAYVQYDKMWRKQPNNPYANYWRGITAYQYEWLSGYKSSGVRITPDQRTQLWEAARSGLQRAVELKPDFAAANSAYGSFLSAIPGEEKRGLDFMRKAVQLEPKTAGLWRSLGEVVINPYFDFYDPKEGEQALLKAARLDPLYAAPHYALIRLYVETKRFKEAQRELQIYTRLVGPQKAASTIRFFKSTIDKGLKT
jgi:tetratricopeptide (TPR) repeat protein